MSDTSKPRKESFPSEEAQAAAAKRRPAIAAVPGEPEVPGTAEGMGAGGGAPHGSPAAAPLGGTGGDAGRQSGQGAGGEAGMPRLGPAPGGNTTATDSGPLGPKPAGPDRG